MLCQNHNTVRHAYEMSQATGTDQLDYQKMLKVILDEMRRQLMKKNTVILTHRDLARGQSPNPDEIALVLTTEEELDLYKRMLGQRSEMLRHSMQNAKLQNGSSR